EVLAKGAEDLRVEVGDVGVEAVRHRLLEEVGVGDVLADDDPEQARYHGDDLERRALGSAGEADDSEAGEEADPPRGDADLVPGQDHHQTPEEASDDRGDETARDPRAERRPGVTLLLGNAGEPGMDRVDEAACL